MKGAWITRGLPLVAVAGAALLWGCSKRPSDERDPGTAVGNLQLYPGLEATLFAAEPVLSNPTNLDVDHRGRVWVCDVVNYRERGERGERAEGDRILILEDLDGDGAADSTKVFYQGRDINAALGIAVLGNRVIVTAAPDVIVFTDEDGDDRPDRKESLFVHSGKPQDDHSTHSFSFGPDGRLYWNMGNAGRHIHDKSGRLATDRAGNPVLDRNFARSLRESPENERPAFLTGLEALESPYQGGMVFRCDLDGSGLEVLGHNFRNNYEVAVDSLGGLWQADNDNDGSFACRVNYILEGGNYGYRDEMTGAANQVRRTGQHLDGAWRHWHQNDPGVVPNLLITGAGSPTGVTAYEGRLLPPVFWDQVLAADAGPGVVRGIVAEKDGAGFTARAVDLLKTGRDKWVRPVDVAVAPDGSLFVSDWYDPVIGWNRQADAQRGRIFRIAPEGRAYRPPQHAFDSVTGAIEALKSPNSAVRYLAWKALDTAGTEAEAALLQLFEESSNVRHRARALWLLARQDSTGEEHLRRAAGDPDEDIRIVALRAARGLGLDPIPFVEALAEDAAPHVRREAAIALRGSRSPHAPALWARLALQHVAGDRWSLEALGIAADGLWNSYLDAWLSAAGDGWNSPSGRDLIWRSRAAATPAYLARILNAPDTTGPAAARYVRAFDFQPPSAERRRILRQLAFGRSGNGKPLEFFVASEALLRLPRLDLDADADSRRQLNGLPGRGEGTEQYALLVQRYELKERYPSLVGVAARNKDNPIGIAAARTVLDAGAEEAILEFLHAEPALAAAAVEAAGNTRVPAAVPLLERVALDDGLPDAARDRAVRSLAGFGSGAAALVAMARRGDLPDELAPAAGAAMARSMHVRLREEASRLLPMPPLRGNQTLPQMTDLLVLEGDPGNGAAVFERATCSDCHVVHDRGTEFGPDLSKIGDKLSKAGLYEAVLDPSAGVSPEFELVHIALADGDEVSGFVLDESGDAVTLHMEGGTSASFPKTSITGRRRSSVSAMPDDLQNQMSVADLVDLVEYLASLR